MTVYDLNRDQLEELKVMAWANMQRRDPYYDEIANIDDYISDQEIFDLYEGIAFTPDDFMCSAGSDDKEDTCSVVIEGANRHDISFDLQYVAQQIESGYTNGILSDGATWYIE